MKITNNYNYPNSSFKSLKISYGAENNLYNVSKNYIKDIFEAGHRLENTQYYDLLMLDDLSLRIKEKANNSFIIKEPVKVLKVNAQELKIIGVNACENCTPNKKNIDLSIKYDVPAKVISILTKLKDLRGVLRLAYVTKLLDESKIIQNLPEAPKFSSREKVVDLLMYKFGDLVKP